METYFPFIPQYIIFFSLQKFQNCPCWPKCSEANPICQLHFIDYSIHPEPIKYEETVYLHYLFRYWVVEFQPCLNCIYITIKPYLWQDLVHNNQFKRKLWTNWLLFYNKCSISNRCKLNLKVPPPKIQIFLSLKISAHECTHAHTLYNSFVKIPLSFLFLPVL